MQHTSTRTARRLTLLALSALLALGACADSADTTDPQSNSSTTPMPSEGDIEVLRSELTRASAKPPQVDEASVFGFNLYATLAADAGQDNLAISPSSLSTVLGMVALGADGETADEIVATLGYEQDAQAVAAMQNDLESSVLASRNERFVYEPANQIWLQQGFEVKSSYLDDIALHYGAGLSAYSADIAPGTLAVAINTWIEEITKGLLKDVLDAGTLTPLPRAILANAFYLNAKWAKPFPDYRSAEGPFTTLGGETTTAWLMQDEREIPYVQGDNYEAVRLDLGQGDSAMWIILPSEGAFGEVEAALSPEMVRDLGQNASPRLTDLIVPRFTFETSVALRDPLIELGIRKAFSTEADFSRLSDQAFNLTGGLQRVFIAVDEEGTTGAVTSIIWGAGSAPPNGNAVFHATRPFLFLLTHDASKEILLMGRVTSPEATFPERRMP